MRTIERSSAFKRDYRRAKTAPRHGRELDVLVTTVVAALVSDKTLPAGNRDHNLGGEWAGYRECHVRPDLLLIYSKPDANILRLVRPGSHSELFG